MSQQMKEARWRAFGHNLRLSNKAPSQQAMNFYFEVPEKAKRFSGRKRKTLPVVLNEDIKERIRTHNLPVNKFETVEDLNKLREIAADRNKWKELSSMICSIAEGGQFI